MIKQLKKLTNYHLKKELELNKNLNSEIVNNTDIPKTNNINTKSYIDNEKKLILII